MPRKPTPARQVAEDVWQRIRAALPQPQAQALVHSLLMMRTPGWETVKLSHVVAELWHICNRPEDDRG